jgi:hypothetical protein
MRNFLLLISFCFLTSMSLSGQDYQSALGLRLGSPVSLSFKTFMGGGSNALELFVSYRTRTYDRGFGFEDYRWTSIGLGGAYQIHNEISAVDGLYWYYGGGASVYFWSYSDDVYFGDESSIGFGLQGNIGLDYKFDNLPLNVSLDWVPTLFLNGYGSGFGADYGALSIRYVISE